MELSGIVVMKKWTNKEVMYIHYGDELLNMISIFYPGNRGSVASILDIVKDLVNFIHGLRMQ